MNSFLHKFQLIEEKSSVFFKFTIQSNPKTIPVSIPLNEKEEVLLALFRSQRNPAKYALPGGTNRVSQVASAKAHNSL